MAKPCRDNWSTSDGIWDTSNIVMYKTFDDKFEPRESLVSPGRLAMIHANIKYNNTK